MYAHQMVASKSASASSQLPILSQMEAYINTLNDTSIRDDTKLKVLQDISNNFEALSTAPQFPQLVSHLVNICGRLLQETVPQFIGENNTQQLRKLMLEMIHRMPYNEHFKGFSKNLNTLMLKIVQYENEENTLVALRIIIELQKQYRPAYSADVQNFLQFCKGLYRDLTLHIDTLFEPRQQIKVGEIQDLNIEDVLKTAFCVTPIYTEQKLPDASNVVYTLLPRATQSLKVLSEIPIIVVLLYQIHKSNVQQDIADFIPLILNTLTMAPSAQQRSHPNFNRELFIEFLSAQVKALSFLAFLARMFLDLVNMQSSTLVKGILSMLEMCPPEVTHLRRELLVGTRHLLASDLRSKFVNFLPQFFNENIVIGSGWTANETLRPLVYSMLADLVHHVRANLHLSALNHSVRLFARCIHDPTLPVYVQAMCCKLMLNLVECIVACLQQQPHARSNNEVNTVRDLLFYMFEVFIRKFKVVAVQHLPAIMDRFDTNGQMKTQSHSSVHMSNSQTSQAEQPAAVDADKEARNGSVDHQSVDSSPMDENSEMSSSETQNETEENTNRITVTHEPVNRKTSTQIAAQYWGVSAAPMSISDCRSLVKVLVGGVKTCVWGIGNSKGNNTPMNTVADANYPSATPMKLLSGAETAIFVKLLKYGLRCLYIYTIQPATGSQPGQYVRAPASGAVRSKEEKEALEHFASVFTYLHVLNFKEIFSTNIGFMVEQISGNYALQLICNYFLITAHTSAAFGSIMVEYLLDRLNDMGSSSDKATLYLKLFKLVFQSVSVSGTLGFHGENEQMLKPHLHPLVHRAMDLALNAREPGNYFLLLRQLFRSIGGGSHDLLYQEFLPLLPSLLQKLNRLQSSAHRQQMRELFVELCLTVPVRLSSLLPYLPLLMDPLVCALNGSQTLVQQGLRTLELCVDNLQPEYLYEHMAPVRASLMQGLWRTVGSSDESSGIAFRILGKFGGSNRKMLAEPQQLSSWSERQSSVSISLQFSSAQPSAGEKSIAPAAQWPPEGVNAALNVCDAVRVANQYIHKTSSESLCRTQSCVFLKSLLYGAFRYNIYDFDSAAQGLQAQLVAINQNENIETCPSTQLVYKMFDSDARQVYVEALTAIFFAVVAKDLRTEVLHFFNALVRNLTIQSILEQTGPDRLRETEYYSMTHLDSAILIDAISNALGDATKDYCHSAVLAMTLIKDTAATVMGSLDRACKLPFFSYLLSSICSLCYSTAWYARLGGCAGVGFMLEHMPQSWIQTQTIDILRSLIQVLLAQYGEVSHGALDMAMAALRSLFQVICAKTVEKQLLKDIMMEILPHVQSPNSYLREQCMSMCAHLSQHSRLILGDLHSLIKDELVDFVSESQKQFLSMSVGCQIGFMEAFAYWHCVEPRILMFDPDDSSQKSFSDNLIYLCQTDETQLKKRPCYEQMILTSNTSGSMPLASFSNLKLASLKALTACFISAKPKPSAESESNENSARDNLFLVVLKTLTHGSSQLQAEAFECLKKAMNVMSEDSTAVDRNLLHTAMRPVLLNLNEYKNLQLNVAKRLLYLTRLTPKTFSEKFAGQLVVHLKKSVDASVQNPSSRGAQPFMTQDMECTAVILDILHQIPAAAPYLIGDIVPVIAKGEMQLSIEPGSMWRAPLLKFLIRFPAETINFFLDEKSMADDGCKSLLLWLLKQPDAKPCREIFNNNPNFASNLLRGHTMKNDGSFSSSDSMPRTVLELYALRLCSVLLKRETDFVEKSKSLLVDQLRVLWKHAENSQKHNNKQDTSDLSRLQTPKLAVKCLLAYFKHDPSDIDLLFEIVRCFSRKPMADFSFVRNFLECQIIPNYSVAWKRTAFMRFVEFYSKDDSTGADMNKLDAQVKVLQYVILPCLHYSLEHGDGDTLIGTAPEPDNDSDENLVSVWVCKVIDQAKSRTQLPDSLHILLYQLSCLFVEFAPQHIHDSSSKKQGSRLRKFMLFAWPCLQQNSSQDPTTKYHGHLLIAHIIDKFAINRKIVLQVFHSLLKAHGLDPRGVIKQALTILTPAVPQRMEDGHLQLTQFAKKLITEEGHTPAQLVHLMQLITRHYKVYFPVRRQLTQYLMSGIQKLVTNQGTVENRKLAVEVCEMIIKWELYRLKETQESQASVSVSDPEIAALLSSPVTSEPKSIINGNGAAASSEKATLDTTSPIDKIYVDQVVNILVRMASQVPEQVSGSSQNQQSAEALNKRSLQLLKVALKPDIWGHTASIKLQYLEKVLAMAEHAATFKEQPSTPQAAMHIGLDVLAFLVGVMPAEQVLPTIQPIQRSLIFALKTTSTPVVRSLYQLITRLLAVLKADLAGISELDLLNTGIFKFIQDVLKNYEKSAGSVSSLFGAMTVLRAMCAPQPSYLDRFVPELLLALSKLVKEHVTPIQPEAVKTAADIISLCLELLRPRLEILDSEKQKKLSEQILVPLIEKSSSARVMGTIVKLADDWIRAADRFPQDSQLAASLPDRQSLLVKLMLYLERRFTQENELNKHFLATVLFVYSTPSVRNGEICAKLEPAFHAGLAHGDHAFARQFFAVYDKSIARNPYERLWYIICMQNWMAMRQHYWIRQCIRLVLSAVDMKAPLTMQGDVQFKPIFANQDITMEDLTNKVQEMDTSESQETGGAQQQIKSIVEKQKKFLTEASVVTLESAVDALCALCHADNCLSENIWLQLFPSVWGALSDSQRQNLSKELIPFLASGSHVTQKEAPLSAVNTFLEALAKCQPPVAIRAQLLKYLGSSHNLWHRSILLLEEQAWCITESGKRPENMPAMDRLDILDSLISLYGALCETDMWSFMWCKRASHPETRTMLAYTEQGIYSKALATVEQAMARKQTQLNAASGQAASSGLNMNVISELKLWENVWVRCARELNQWDVLKEFSNNSAIQDPMLLLECAWRKPDAHLMKDALSQLEASCPPEQGWQLHLFRGFWFVSQQLDDTQQQQREIATAVEKCKEQANSSLIETWTKLPSLVSHSHVPILQAAHRVQELSEASQVTQSMSNPMNANSSTALINDIKSIVKTWRNRAPTFSDPLSHWLDVFSWRLHHYMSVLNLFDSYESQQQQALLPIHSCATCLVQLAKVARQHGHVDVALNELHKLHTIPNLPTMDSFVKLYQQVKCYIAVADVETANESLLDALELIEGTNISYFSKEQSAKLYALKGHVLSRLNRPQDADKAFSASLQMHDSLNRAWALWGVHLQNQFYNNYKRPDRATISNGINALISFLEAARQESELRARKHLSRALWTHKCLSQLIANGTDTSLLATKKQLTEKMERFGRLVPAANWLPWVPHILLQLKSGSGCGLRKLIEYVAGAYPQALYFHIRRLIKDDLPLEMQDKINSFILGKETEEEEEKSAKDDFDESKNWKECLEVVLFQMHQAHPADMRALDRLSKELCSLPFHWSERALQWARGVLRLCCRLLFDARNQVHSVQITAPVEKQLRQLIEHINEDDAHNLWSLSSDVSLRASLCDQLSGYVSVRGRVMPLLLSLAKCISTLEARVNALPRKELLRTQSPWMADFSSQMANVHVPGETLISKTSHYCSEIAKFSSHIELVQNAQTCCRRLSIRAHNGKLVTLAIEPVDSTADFDKQQPLMTLFRMINLLLNKDCETSRRLLQINIPRVIPLGDRFRLVENDESSMTMLDIMTTLCQSRQISPMTLVCGYYERLVDGWSRGSQPGAEMLRAIHQEVVERQLPSDTLKTWIGGKLTDAMDYYTFRRQLCTHLSLLGLLEFVLHLTWLPPDQLNIQMNTGAAHVSLMQFDLHEFSGELDANRSVPFRLTPSLCAFLGLTVGGQMAPSMKAAARCLDKADLLSLLRPALIDQYVDCNKELIDKVHKACNAVLTRLKNVSKMDGVRSKVDTLICEAQKSENLSRMDPAWHPWF